MKKNWTIFDYEQLAEDAHVPCAHCNTNYATHYGDHGEPVCQVCLRDQPRVIDNGDNTASFGGVLVGMGL